MSDTNGLEGLTVGVPAARRADQTANLVEREGGSAVVGPTMTEIDVGDDEELRAATEAVVSGGVAWSVHLTGVGTRRWFEHAAAWGLGDDLVDRLRVARLVPRGAKAVAALRSRGLEPTWVPEGETSEEIVDWLRPQLAGGERVAVQLHGERLPRLTDELAGAGAELVEVLTYRWALPDDLAPARALVEGLLAGEVHALVVTSAPQLRNLLTVAEHDGQAGALRERLRERVFVAAVGEVAAAGIRDEDVGVDLVADPPRLGHLVRALAAAGDEVRAKALA